MHEALHRLQRLAERRLPALTRYRQPEALPVTLHRRRIYIVPTPFGLGFAVLMLVMLMGALNYNNNAALLLTCLLGAAAAASRLYAFRALDGLVLASVQAGRAVAGESMTLIFTFQSDRPRSALRIDMESAHESFATAAGETTVHLPLTSHQRGWQPLPRMKVWSTWPLGLFQAWSWLYPQQRVIVWPRPEPAGPPPPQAEHAQRQTRKIEGDELAALRDYRNGDPIRRIAWKASARSPHLLVKDFQHPLARQAWQLDWRLLAGLDKEARIARLARWVNEAHRQGQRYGLNLPGESILPHHGGDHYARCMDALAQQP